MEKSWKSVFEFLWEPCMAVLRAIVLIVMVDFVLFQYAS